MNYKTVIQEINTNKLNRIYLLHGEEEYAKQKVLQEIEKQLSSSLKQLNYQKIDGEKLEIGTLIEYCEALPVMDAQRIVVVRDYGLLVSARGTASDNDKIINYLKAVPEHLVLVFYCVGKADTRKKLFKYLKKAEEAVVCDFQRLNQNELIQWISQQCQSQNISISNREAYKLIESVGSDMLILEGEINKLCACAGEQSRITLEMITQLTEIQESETVFMLVDNISQKKPAEAYQLLRKLTNEGIEPMNILALITRQFRLLIQVKNNVGVKQTIKGVPPWAVKKYVAQSKKFTGQQLVGGLKLCAEINNGIKNGTYNDQNAAVELLIMKICSNRIA